MYRIYYTCTASTPAQRLLPQRLLPHGVYQPLVVRGAEHVALAAALVVLAQPLDLHAEDLGLREDGALAVRLGPCLRTYLLV